MTSQTPREATSRSFQAFKGRPLKGSRRGAFLLTTCELLLISVFVLQVMEDGDASVCLGSLDQGAESQQEHPPRWD